MRSVVLGLFVLAACGERTLPASPITQTANTTAEREFTRSLELDYRNPMAQGFRAPVPQFVVAVPPYVDLFKARCVTGDRSACIRATSYSIIVDEVLLKQILPTIEANCRDGHDLSCRYLVSLDHSERSYPDLSDAELRRGCKAGLLRECVLLSGDDERFGAEIGCLYARTDCSQVAWKYRSAKDGDSRARYLLELGCQSGMYDACHDLVTAYRTGEWVEPVPGRGVALTRFMCDAWPEKMECTWGEAQMFMPRR